MHVREDIIPGVCFLIKLKDLRHTNSVDFYSIPGITEGLDAVTLVRHQAGAYSPTLPEDADARPWYMHPDQEDNLIVYEGVRMVDLYTKEHGKMVSFEVRPGSLMMDGKLYHEGQHVFGWYTHVFHRVHSPEGSLSMNFARWEEGFDIDSNFSIYGLNTTTGDHEVLREGKLDQPVIEVCE